MLIPTTMKFIVKGKSVDFRNREGSSPSVPIKKKRAQQIIWSCDLGHFLFMLGM